MRMKKSTKVELVVVIGILVILVIYLVRVTLPEYKIINDHFNSTSTPVNTPVQQKSAKDRESRVVTICENITALETQADQMVKDCSQILKVLKTFNPNVEWQAPDKGAWPDTNLEGLQAHQESLQSDIADLSNAEAEMLSDLSGYIDQRKITNAVSLPSNTVFDIGDSTLAENVLVISYLGYTSIPRTDEDRKSFGLSFIEWWKFQSETNTLPVDYNMRKIPKYHMALYLGSKYADSFRAEMQKIAQ